MAERRIGLIMHGVTGRMGMNQHLIRSIVAIRKEGGVPLRNGDRLMPDPIIIGRNREKLETLAKEHGLDVARLHPIEQDACRKLLRYQPRPTAIFAGNDAMAIGALSALAEAGVPVPGET